MKAKLLKVGLGLMLVALVLASLIYFLNPFQTALELGQSVKVRSDIEALSQALMAYQQVSGVLPSTSQGLAALVTKPLEYPVTKPWYQMLSQLPVDPWGNPYRYEQPGKHHPEGFDLYTTGGPRGRAMGNW